MIKTFSLWNYSLVYWSIQPFIGFYYFVIYWFFSWKISFLSTAIVKCAVVKTIILYYLGNKDTIYMFCLFYFSIPNFAIIFSRAYRQTCRCMEILSSFMKSPDSMTPLIYYFIIPLFSQAFWQSSLHSLSSFWYYPITPRSTEIYSLPQAINW